MRIDVLQTVNAGKMKLDVVEITMHVKDLWFAETINV